MTDGRRGLGDGPARPQGSRRLLAPSTAALVGGGPEQLRSGDRAARILGPLAIAAGVATTLAVIANTDGAPGWVEQILLPVGVLAAIALALKIPRRVRIVALAAVLYDCAGHADALAALAAQAS